MNDELRECQARKEMSADAAYWCIVGIVLLTIGYGFWTIAT